MRDNGNDECGRFQNRFSFPTNFKIVMFDRPSLFPNSLFFTTSAGNPPSPVDFSSQQLFCPRPWVTAMHYCWCLAPLVVFPSFPARVKVVQSNLESGIFAILVQRSLNSRNIPPAEVSPVGSGAHARHVPCNLVGCHILRFLGWF